MQVASSLHVVGLAPPVKKREFRTVVALAVVRKYTAEKCDTLAKLYSELEDCLARVCVREEPTASSTPLVRAAHRLA